MLKRYRYSLLTSLLVGLSLLLGRLSARAQRPAPGGAGAVTSGRFDRKQ